MNSRWDLGSAFKVKLRLHYSWIAVVIFMTAAMMTQFSTHYNILQRLILGLLACLLFTIIIVLRALIINIFATAKGAVVKSSTIFAIGNVMEMDKTYPSLEVLLAIVGLLANLILASILFLCYQILANTDSVMVYVLVQWLAFIFFMLVLFDFLPGLPLDGGRILRALLWKTTSNYDRITKILSWTGWIIGLGFIITGIMLIINTREWFVGVLLILPGLILQNSSTHQRHQIKKQTGNQKPVEEGRASTSTG